MTTYNRIITIFRELLNSTPLEKITVADICKNAKISRKTFYTYFHDKNNVIEKIIYDNISKPIYTLHSILVSYESAPTIILERMYQTFNDDRVFFEKISCYIGQNSFRDILIEQTTAINLEILASFDIPQDEKEYMAYYYAASHTMLLIKWIKDKMTIPPKTMAEFYDKWALQYWRDLNSRRN